VGEIVELGHDVRQALQGDAEQLLEQVRGQAVVHQDETGWRQDGQNGYVWVTASDGPQAVRYFHYAPSRSHLIAQYLLGERFRGTLVSDFYAAYNLIPGLHQRCWVHLLRDLHDLKQAHAQAPEVLAWAQAVHGLYDQAQTWLADHPSASDAERQAQYTALYGRACELGQCYAFTAGHPCWALAKRLLRHQEELFQFVLRPDVPADNRQRRGRTSPAPVGRPAQGQRRYPLGRRHPHPADPGQPVRHLAGPPPQPLAGMPGRAGPARTGSTGGLALNSFTPTVNSYDLDNPSQLC
jgi:transposase